jgi:hypothetical protein
VTSPQKGKNWTLSCKRKGDIFDVHPIESYISYQVSSVPVIAHTSFLPPSIVEWF